MISRSTLCWLTALIPSARIMRSAGGMSRSGGLRGLLWSNTSGIALAVDRCQRLRARTRERWTHEEASLGRGRSFADTRVAGNGALHRAADACCQIGLQQFTVQSA